MSQIKTKEEIKKSQELSDKDIIDAENISNKQ